MPWSAFAFGNVQAIVKRVTKVAHGFETGDIVQFDGLDYVLSIANSEANSGGSLMVSNIIDADTFEACACGYVTGLTAQDPYTAGANYFLSPTNAGELTLIKPATPGQVELECFFAVTATEGWFFGGAGQLVAPGGGGGFTWIVQTVNVVMAVNAGYIVNGAGSLSLLLPTVSAVGDVIEVATLGVNGCTIAQNAGQTINIVDDTSTVGIAGSVILLPTNTVLSGSLRLVCTVANTAWKAISGTGIWNPV